MKEPFEVFATRIAPSLRSRVAARADASGVKLSDFVISAPELHLSRRWQMKPVPRPTIVRKKGTKGGR
jgi:hypothetical protein